MSVNDIMNYVNKTPENTNPTILKQLVESEIGEYIEEASNKALEKLGSKTEPGKVYVNDFTKTPVVIPGDTPAYMNHISGEMPDLSKAVVKIDLHGDIVEMAVTDMFYAAMPDVQVQEVRFTENAPPMMLVFGSVVANEMELAPGLYLAAAGTEQVRLISVQLPETVQPIDPKYLPGVCLPVVELPPEIIAEVEEKGFAINLPTWLVESLAKAFESRTPLYIVFDAGEDALYPGAYFSAIACGALYMINDENSVPSFEFVIAGITSRFFRGIDGTWVLMMEI